MWTGSSLWFWLGRQADLNLDPVLPFSVWLLKDNGLLNACALEFCLRLHGRQHSTRLGAKWQQKVPSQDAWRPRSLHSRAHSLLIRKGTLPSTLLCRPVGEREEGKSVGPRWSWQCPKVWATQRLGSEGEEPVLGHHSKRDPSPRALGDEEWRLEPRVSVCLLLWLGSHVPRHQCQGLSEPGYKPIIFVTQNPWAYKMETITIAISKSFWEDSKRQ